MVEKSKKELTEKETAFLHYLFSDDVKGNFRKAMRMAGYSDNLPIIVILRQLKDEIVEKAHLYLASSSAQATFAMIEGMTDPNAMGTKNKLEAAKQILDRAGVVKPTDGIDLKIPEGGLIILPAKKTTRTEVEVIDE